MTNVSATRANLRASLGELRIQEIDSTEDLRTTRLRAFEDANELVREGGVEADESLALLREHADSVDAIFREQWPEFYRAAQSELTFEDHLPPHRPERVFSPHVVLLDRGPNNHTATPPREPNWRKVILVLAAVAIVLALALWVGAIIR